MKKWILFIIMVLLFIPFSVKATTKDIVSFSKCIDGDTIEVIKNNNKTKIRLLAVDTPETKHPTKGEEPYGKEASHFTCEQIRKSSTIELEYDENSEKQDKYNRVLAWVWTDGSLLQEALIKKGYAKVAYLYGDYTYTSLLQKYEKEAKEKNLGIWGDYEEDQIPYYIWIGLFFIIIIGCFISKNFQKKVKRKIKNQQKKELRKLLKKSKKEKIFLL